MKFLLTSVYSNIENKLKELIKEKPENTLVAFIPTAGDVYEDKWFVDLDKNKLIEQGFKIKEINLSLKNMEELEKDISGCSVIFVGGGNVFYLLQEMRKSGFDKVISKLFGKEIVYVGSSAGSVVIGPNIEPIIFIDDPLKAPELKSYEGLNLVDFMILPHYGKTKYEEKYKQIIDKANEINIKIKKLTDSEYIIF